MEGKNGKPYLFLDFDFTCTYMYGVEDDLSEFLDFCVNKFKVYWCSFAEYSHIVNELKGNVSDTLLHKILYKKIEGKSKLEFIYSIVGNSNAFLYIDDDVNYLDFRLLKDAGLSNNYIKAINNKYDLKRIRKELDERLRLPH